MQTNYKNQGKNIGPALLSLDFPKDNDIEQNLTTPDIAEKPLQINLDRRRISRAFAGVWE